MTSSILGKRNRSLREADVSNALSGQRARKRAHFVIASDQENENPFVTQRGRKRRAADDGAFMDLDAESRDCRPKKLSAGSIEIATVPAKHGKPQSRVAVSSPRPAHSAAPAATSSPSTPRHHDAARQKVQITPRHRVGLAGKLLTPQTPRTPATPRSIAPTVYNAARQLFARSGEHGGVIGRNDEKSELVDLVSTNMRTMSSGCIYVSGPPGTGKSALVNEVCQEFQDAETCSHSYINCMGVKNARDIFIKLFEDYSANDGILRGDETDTLRDLFFARESSYLVVLDEIDHLLDVDLNLLYKLFEWSLDERSSLILIGIANALDFTDRFLPRLKARGLRPHLLPFLPYTGPQIVEIITGKLKALMPAGSAAAFVPFLHPTAILFLSKKMASTGDLRRAFDVCRRAVDLIERETKELELRKAAEATPETTPSVTPSKTPLMENINLSSPSVARSPTKSASLSPKKPTATKPNPLAHLSAETAPRATIAHMARVTSAIFNSGAAQRFQGLNLQQKAVLCALVGLEERNRQRRTAELPAPETLSRKNRGAAESAPTVKALFDLYVSACRKDNALHPLTSTEFGDVVGGLETLSLVSALDGKNGTFQALTPSGTPSRRGRGKALASLTGAKAEERKIASNVGLGEVKNMIAEVKVGRAILESFLLDGNV